MALLGVSVDCISPSRNISASGIKICDHFVITHSTIILDILKHYFKEYATVNFDKSTIDFHQYNINQFIKESDLKYSVILPTDNSQTDLCIDAYMESVFIFSPMILEFLKFFSQRKLWKFDKNETIENVDYENIYLGTFVVLRIKNEGNLWSCLEEFSRLVISPRKGATLLIDGCPFGKGRTRSVFLNSICKGIICNVSRQSNIFLTDARCILGCEGAPGYSVEEKFGVCGLVISPFCWLKGEWVGLTFMASLKPLLACMKKTIKYLSALPSQVHQYIGISSWEKNHADLTSIDIVSSLKLHDINVEVHNLIDIVNKLECAIVRVVCQKISNIWGTGFVIEGSNGLVVTCAHVTRNNSKKDIEVIFSTGERDSGLVIYESHRHDGLKEFGQKTPLVSDAFEFWDIAIIQLRNRPTHSIPIAKELPLLGTTVIIGGYPLFNSEELPSPTFSIGNLAKVMCCPREFLHFEHSGREHCDVKNASEIPFSDVKNMWRKSCANLMWQHFISSDLNGDVPVIMQTTCGVYGGVSGGPVVALHPVKGPVVIGVINCCMRDTNNGISFPHVNLATPSILLAEAVDQFNITKDTSSFDLHMKKKIESYLTPMKFHGTLISKL